MTLHGFGVVVYSMGMNRRGNNSHLLKNFVHKIPAHLLGFLARPNLDK